MIKYSFLKIGNKRKGFRERYHLPAYKCRVVGYVGDNTCSESLYIDYSICFHNDDFS